MEHHISRSVEETLEIAKQFAKTLQPNDILAFSGDLGAGKTTFIKGIAAEITRRKEIGSSPTFVYLNIYSGDMPVYHFDLYRLKHKEEFLDLGFEEILFSEGICCLEWAEKIESFLPQKHIAVAITAIDEKSRAIRIVRNG